VSNSCFQFGTLNWIKIDKYGKPKNVGIAVGVIEEKLFKKAKD